MPRKKKAVKPARVGLVLDESGSMGVVWHPTIGAVNEYFNSIRKSDNTVSLLKLGSQYAGGSKYVYKAKAAASVPDLTTTSYIPGDMTPLCDAIGRMITDLDAAMAEDENAVVVVMTDGQENASREFDAESIKKLISEKQESGRWTFLYLAANVDELATGASYGFYAHNTQGYSHDAAGTSNVMRSAAGATVVAAAAPSAAAFADSGQLGIAEAMIQKGLASDVNAAWSLINAGEVTYNGSVVMGTTYVQPDELDKIKVKAKAKS
jgi:hypothetical protein